MPKLRIATRLAQKTLGMRYLMDVISLDATLVRGSHGRPTDRPEDGPLFITSKPDLLGAGPVAAGDVKSLLLEHVFGAAKPIAERRHDAIGMLGTAGSRARLPGDRGGMARIGHRAMPHWHRRSRPLPADEPGLAASRQGTARRSPMLNSRAASASRPGWDPRDWTLDQAVRVYAALCKHLRRRADERCGSIGFAAPPTSGNWSRSIAACRCTPISRATRCARRKALRSNMRAVFEAVAHRNPYPAEQLTEAAWNQLVLKALFVGSRCTRLSDSTVARNPTLARMLCDYAHERWAASRPVSPELWRCVGPFATGSVLADFDALFERGTPGEQQAAALALARGHRSRSGAAARNCMRRRHGAAAARAWPGSGSPAAGN